MVNNALFSEKKALFLVKIKNTYKISTCILTHWSGKETLKFFERWKDKTQVTTILYIICNNTFLGWNWNIIKIETLALSTTIFQTYSLALDGADLSINEISCSWLFFSFILLSMSFLNITLNHTTTLLFKALFHYSI